MTTRVPVERALFAWAIERSRRDREEIEQQFPQLRAWEDEERQPTLRQLEAFAAATRTPVGYFFLSEPPTEDVPLPDMRTLPATELQRPSADLLDTVTDCEQRQAWYREFAQGEGQPPLPLIGSATTSDPPVEIAAAIRSTIGHQPAAGAQTDRWEDALRQLIDKVEDAGILVMSSGIVGANSHRQLDPREFRGFALVDDLAPTIFVNRADSVAARAFTLAHELAHLWLGRSALDLPDMGQPATHEVERWCNQVAAEVLVPAANLQALFQPLLPLRDEAQRLARTFKVSTLVVLHALFDAELIGWSALRQAYEGEQANLRAPAASEGGDFYRTQATRVSKRFARALVINTMEGQTLYRDAFRLLGVRKQATFEVFTRE